jgi:hypothetical protein
MRIRWLAIQSTISSCAGSGNPDLHGPVGRVPSRGGTSDVVYSYRKPWPALSLTPRFGVALAGEEEVDMIETVSTVYGQ